MHTDLCKKMHTQFYLLTCRGTHSTGNMKAAEIETKYRDQKKEEIQNEQPNNRLFYHCVFIRRPVSVYQDLFQDKA